MRRLNPLPTYPSYGNHTSVAFLPYANKIIDQISGWLLKLKMKPIFRSPSKTFQILSTPKQKLIPSLTKGIDSFLCSCGEGYDELFWLKISFLTKILVRVLSYQIILQFQNNMIEQEIKYLLIICTSLDAPSPIYVNLEDDSATRDWYTNTRSVINLKAIQFSSQ